MDKQVKVLVVDDDISIRKTLKRILENKGYFVDLAVNGRQAINKTKKTAYNIAILDIRLPDIEGVELLELMKEAVPRTRKIMVTGYPTQNNVISSINNKADAYMIKPIEVKELLGKIKEQLQSQQEENTFSEKKVDAFIEDRLE